MKLKLSIITLVILNYFTLISADDVVLHHCDGDYKFDEIGIIHYVKDTVDVIQAYHYIDSGSSSGGSKAILETSLYTITTTYCIKFTYNSKRRFGSTSSKEICKISPLTMVLLASKLRARQGERGANKQAGPSKHKLTISDILINLNVGLSNFNEWEFNRETKLKENINHEFFIGLNGIKIKITSRITDLPEFFKDACLVSGQVDSCTLNFSFNEVIKMKKLQNPFDEEGLIGYSYEFIFLGGDKIDHPYFSGNIKALDENKKVLIDFDNLLEGLSKIYKHIQFEPIDNVEPVQKNKGNRSPTQKAKHVTMPGQGKKAQNQNLFEVVSISDEQVIKLDE
jgi:hypothetical protein